MLNISTIVDFLNHSPNLRDFAEDLYFEKRAENGIDDSVWELISEDQQIWDNYIPVEKRPSTEEIVSYFSNNEDDSLMELINELEDEIL